MSIEVKLPNGSVVVFPDGTSEDVMRGAINSLLGRGNAPQGATTRSPEQTKRAEDAALFGAIDGLSAQQELPSRPNANLQRIEEMALSSQRAYDPRAIQTARGEAEGRELPYNLRQMSPESALADIRGEGPLVRRGADPNAELGVDSQNRQYIRTNNQNLYFDSPRVNFNDVRDVARGTVNFLEEAAPYLSTGGASASMGALRAAGGQALTGIMEEGTEQAVNAMEGQGFDWKSVRNTAIAAAAGEIGGRVVAAALGPVLRPFVSKNIRVLNEDGTLTDDAIAALNRANVTPEQADDAVRSYIRNSDQFTPEQAETFNLFTKYKVQPTRANVMRTRDNWQAQQELMKRSNLLSETVEGQRGRISTLFDDTANRIGGTGVPVYDAISGKALELDQQISDLYRVARESAPTEKFVRLDGTVESLRKLAKSENKVTGGILKAIKGDLQERGVIDQNWKVVGRIDVDTAEMVRQYISSLYTSTTDRGRMVIRQLKDSIDDDVFRAAGDDVFKAARSAKASFEEGLRRSRLNKFDQNQRSLVRNILENKINPDNFFNNTVLSQSWRADDIAEVKNYLLSGTDDQIAAGTDAWDSLRAEAVEWIKDQAFRSTARGENGVAELSADALRKALSRIGNKKMSVLFSPEENQFLDDMMKIAMARTPVDMTYTGKGPSAQAVAAAESSLRKALERIPVIGGPIAGLADLISVSNQGKIMLNPARDATRAIQNIQSQAAREAIRPVQQGVRSSGAALGVEAGRQRVGI